MVTMQRGWNAVGVKDFLLEQPEVSRRAGLRGRSHGGPTAGVGWRSGAGVLTVVCACGEGFTDCLYLLSRQVKEVEWDSTKYRPKKAASSGAKKGKPAGKGGWAPRAGLAWTERAHSSCPQLIPARPGLCVLCRGAWGPRQEGQAPQRRPVANSHVDGGRFRGICRSRPPGSPPTQRAGNRVCSVYLPHCTQ